MAPPPSRQRRQRHRPPSTTRRVARRSRAERPVRTSRRPSRRPRPACRRPPTPPPAVHRSPPDMKFGPPTAGRDLLQQYSPTKTFMDQSTPSMPMYTPPAGHGPSTPEEMYAQRPYADVGKLQANLYGRRTTAMAPTD